MKNSYWMLILTVLAIACSPDKKEANTPEKLKALIIDGQNNHYVWPKTTMMMQDYLTQTGLFEVNIHRMDSVWLGIKYNRSRPKAYTHFIETYPLDSTALPSLTLPLVLLVFQSILVSMIS